jgi:hypothetical protein
MARKNETLSVLREDELTTVAGGSGVSIGNMNLFGNQAVSKYGPAVAGNDNTTAADHSVAGGKKSTFDASSSALSLIAGLIPGIVS